MNLLLIYQMHMKRLSSLLQQSKDKKPAKELRDLSQSLKQSIMKLYDPNNPQPELPVEAKKEEKKQEEVKNKKEEDDSWEDAESEEEEDVEAGDSEDSENFEMMQMMASPAKREEDASERQILERYAGNIEALNSNIGSMGVCAKQMAYGDVAWRCMDCEKDPTCIICSSCFEKGDHTGHRVQLKRNVGGCCDCGDPEAWDPEHFCSDHKGFQSTPEEVLSKLPEATKNSADKVFTEVCKELKRQSMLLQNADEACIDYGMSEDKLRSTVCGSIYQIFLFLTNRIQEVPAFLYIIDEKLNTIYLGEPDFVRNDSHKSCCARVFATEQRQRQFDKEFSALDPEASLKACTCSVLDLCLQTNYLLDDRTQGLVYEFFFKMFQSYTFKQDLTLSFSANYQWTQMKARGGGHHPAQISAISVQVLTSAEMTMLLMRHKTLRNNILQVFSQQMDELIKDCKSWEQYSRCHTIAHDIKYMARPECLQFCIQETDIVEQLIRTSMKMYFCDSKPPRTDMVQYMQEGAPQEGLMNLELSLIKILNMYLKEVKPSDVAKNQSILTAFLDSFQEVNQRMADKRHHGIYLMPLHRCFAYYITRLLMSHMLEQGSPQDVAVNFQTTFNRFLAQKYAQSKELVEMEFSSSLVATVEDKAIPLVDILKMILDTGIQAVSFVHEISSKKWVYLGQHLEYYPTIYYNVAEKLSYQDIAMFQMVLCLDDGPLLINHVISKFGLDDQLQTLLRGLKRHNLSKKHFAAFRRFDPQKLKNQLICFMRFLAMLCIHETSFLKQIFNRKEDKAENEGENKSEVKQLWAKAMKKEAVHLLMLNKVNVSIQTLKQNMVEVFAKDEVFEEMLFEVSTQSRDIKNQVTFKLKDEFYGWFDPFHYVSLDQHSQIFQMYEQNQLKDKFAEQGLNDVVGDYRQNYEQATGINNQIKENLAKSEILQIIAPLLLNWLKFRKEPQEEAKNDGFGKSDSESREATDLRSIFQHFLQQRPGGASSDSPHDSLGDRFRELQQQFERKLSGPKEEATKAEQEDQVPADEYDEKALHSLVDVNVANHCLKLLVLILQAKRKDLSHIRKYVNAELVDLLREYRNESEAKLKDILTFILAELEASSDGQQAGTSQSEQISSKTNAEGEKSASADEKKEKLKKRQNKLLQKMKSKGSKYLKEKKSETQEVESSSDCHQCAFCTEELRREDFKKHPFGNFAYCSSSKLMYHSIEQTLKCQERAFKNEDLANIPSQDEEEKKSSFQDMLDERTSQFVDSNQSTQKFKEELLQAVGEISTQTKKTSIQVDYLNPFTGSGSIVTNCKHYSHLDCLRKYHLQQETILENQYQRQLSGFIYGEFACPICKSINNSILPSFSFLQLTDHELDSQQDILIDDETKLLMDFYIDFFSELIKHQQGHQTSKTKITSIVLRDIRNVPEQVISTIIDHFIHRFNLVDLKGIADFLHHGYQGYLGNVHSSLNAILQFTFRGIHTVLEKTERRAEDILLSMLKDCLDAKLPGILHEDICSLVIKFLLIGCLTSRKDLPIQIILDAFWPVLKLQFKIAVQYRDGHGKMKADAVEGDIDVSLMKETYLQVSLPTLRKLALTVFVLKSAYLDSPALLEQMKKISAEVDEEEESRLILEFLNLEQPEKKQEGVEVENQAMLGETQTATLNDFMEPVDHHKPLKQILAKLDLQALAEYRKQTSSAVMPQNLMLLTTYFQFDFIEIPSSFLNLQTQFYKKKCCYCEQERVDNATCLLCGKTMCWFKQKDGPCKGYKSEVAGEGLLSYHSRVCEGSNSVFLHTSSGNMILIQNGVSGIFDTPYRNKYGELAHPEDKRLSSFNIDSQGGGKEALAQIRQKYVDFQIANQILSQRHNPDVKHKVYLKNIL